MAYNEISITVIQDTFNRIVSGEIVDYFQRGNAYYLNKFFNKDGSKKRINAVKFLLHKSDKFVQFHIDDLESLDFGRGCETRKYSDGKIDSFYGSQIKIKLGKAAKKIRL
jgi:hypothetical protein